MAATVQQDTPSDRERVWDVRGDSSYATGGYALSNVADKTIQGIDTGGTVIAQYDAANKKVKFVTRATGAEVANASDQSAVTVKLLIDP